MAHGLVAQEQMTRCLLGGVLDWNCTVKQGLRDDVPKWDERSHRCGVAASKLRRVGIFGLNVVPGESFQFILHMM